MSFDALASKTIKEQCKQNHEQPANEGEAMFYTITLPKSCDKSVIQDVLRNAIEQLGAYKG